MLGFGRLVSRGGWAVALGRGFRSRVAAMPETHNPVVRPSDKVADNEANDSAIREPDQASGEAHMVTNEETARQYRLL